MIRHGLKVSLVLTLVLAGSTLAEIRSASAEVPGKVYSACEMPPNDGVSSYRNSEYSGKEITIRGEVGKTFHLGVILTGRGCDTMVRLVFPVPDPNNIYGNFKFLEERDQGIIPNNIAFMCDCSGKIHFVRGIAILDLDSAVVSQSGPSEQ